MRCPHFAKVRETYCAAVSFARLPSHHVDTEGARCTQASHRDCEFYRRYTDGGVGEGDASTRCPLLKEEITCYCELSEQKKHIPYEQARHSLCTSDSHRMCELYLALASARTPTDDQAHSHENKGPKTHRGGE
jgi:hypothetical protein